MPRTFSRIALASIVTLCGAAAHATYCADGSTIESHPGGNCAASLQGAQSLQLTQAQQQAQGQAQIARGGAGGASTNTNTVSTSSALQGSGNSRSGSTSSADGAGSNTGNGNGAVVNLQGDQAGSGDTYASRVIVHPSMIPPTPMSINPQGNLLAEKTGCGPLMIPERDPIYSESPGVFNSEQTPNGYNTTPQLKMDGYGQFILYDRVPQADGSIVLIGSQMIVLAGITNQSGAGNLALGIIKSSGAGGQIGGGASSARQQMTKDAIIIPCIAGVIPAAKPPVEHTTIVFQPPPPAPKPRPKAPIKPRARPTCIPSSLPICPTPKA